MSTPNFRGAPSRKDCVWINVGLCPRSNAPFCREHCRPGHSCSWELLRALRKECNHPVETQNNAFSLFYTMGLVQVPNASSIIFLVRGLHSTSVSRHCTIRRGCQCCSCNVFAFCQMRTEKSVAFLQIGVAMDSAFMQVVRI